MSNDFDFDLICLKSPISFDIEMMRYMVTFSTCSETFIDYILVSYSRYLRCDVDWRRDVSFLFWRSRVRFMHNGNVRLSQAPSNRAYMIYWTGYCVAASVLRIFDSDIFCVVARSHRALQAYTVHLSVHLSASYTILEHACHLIWENRLIRNTIRLSHYKTHWHLWKFSSFYIAIK